MARVKNVQPSETRRSLLETGLRKRAALGWAYTQPGAALP